MGYTSVVLLFFLSDIDECETNPCDQLCTNLVGSYNCSCNNGYQLVNDTECVAEGWCNTFVHLTPVNLYKDQ